MKLGIGVLGEEEEQAGKGERFGDVKSDAKTTSNKEEGTLCHIIAFKHFSESFWDQLSRMKSHQKAFCLFEYENAAAQLFTLTLVKIYL